MHVAIIHPEGNFNNNPQLSFLLDRLCARGARVDIYTSPHPSPLRDEQAGLKVVRQWPSAGRLARDLARLRLGPGLAGAVQGLRFRNFAPDLVIGVDPLGLIAAAQLARRHRKPLAYLSYEIFFAAEAPAWLKNAEIEAASRVELAVVPDAVRGVHLARENRIDPARLFQLPVAGGPRRPAEPGCLRAQLGIDADRRIALFMGTLAEWSGWPRVRDSLPHWPEPWCLVVHQRYGLDAEVDAAAAAVPDRLYVSRGDYPDTADMGPLMGDADLGIVLYEPDYANEYSGLNLAHIGLASGKSSTFLRFGVPLLTHGEGELSTCVAREQLGYLLDEALDLPAALARIPAKDAVAVRRCQEFYDRTLDPSRGAEALLDRLVALARGDGAQAGAS